jgi:hypothetical protein
VTRPSVGPNILINPPVAQGNQGVLNYGGNYSSLSRAARAGRENLVLSFPNLLSVVDTLATADNPNNAGNNSPMIAQALMFMIQYTSEAARFNDVFNSFARIMMFPTTDPNGRGTTRLNSNTLGLENSWDPISNYAIRVSQNSSTPPLWINNVGAFFSFSDVARRLAMIQTNPNRRIPPAGNPSRTEL